MKERLLELAEQAGAGTPESLYGRTDYVVMTKFELEKFAELIIKECLDQCYSRGMNDELYAGQLKAAAYIEEHFGVEE